jgi:hypothetical protein
LYSPATLRTSLDEHFRQILDLGPYDNQLLASNCCHLQPQPDLTHDDLALSSGLAQVPPLVRPITVKLLLTHARALLSLGRIGRVDRLSLSQSEITTTCSLGSGARVTSASRRALLPLARIGSVGGEARGGRVRVGYAVGFILGSVHGRRRDLVERGRGGAQRSDGGAGKEGALGSEEDGHGGKVFTAMMLWGSEAVVNTV